MNQTYIIAIYSIQEKLAPSLKTINKNLSVFTAICKTKNGLLIFSEAMNLSPNLKDPTYRMIFFQGTDLCYLIS